MKLIGFYDYTVVLTYVSLFFAVIGTVQASKGNISAAIACLAICGICDAFDGIVARSKKGRTEEEKNFGIQIDSLVDAIAFGVFPAMLCRHMGLSSVLGSVCCFAYVLCAVIRLGFFNVLEQQRQKTEGGCNKFYRGLPVTSVSMLLPVFYCLRFLLEDAVFTQLLHIMLAVMAFLFILDFSVKKPNWIKIITFGRKK